MSQTATQATTFTTQQLAPTVTLLNHHIFNGYTEDFGVFMLQVLVTIVTTTIGSWVAFKSTGHNRYAKLTAITGNTISALWSIVIIVMFKWYDVPLTILVSMLHDSDITLKTLITGILGLIAAYIYSSLMMKLPDNLVDMLWYSDRRAVHAGSDDHRSNDEGSIANMIPIIIGLVIVATASGVIMFFIYHLFP